MDGMAVSNRVIVRSRFGQFIRECEMAAEDTVKAAVEEGAQISRTLAPVGKKPDPRTVPLKDSIFVQMRGRTSGSWGSFARHALPIEKGARPHTIYGKPGLHFFWDEAGRWWVPAEDFYGIPGLVDVVNHPGNAAQPFLRPAYEQVMARIMQIAKQKYPG